MHCLENTQSFKLFHKQKNTLQKGSSQQRCGHLDYLTAEFFPHMFRDSFWQSIGLLYDASDNVYKEPKAGLKLFLSNPNNMTVSLLQLPDG